MSFCLGRVEKYNLWELTREKAYFWPVLESARVYSWLIREVHGEARPWSCSNDLSPDSPVRQVSHPAVGGERGPRELRNTCCHCRGPPGRPEEKDHFLIAEGEELPLKGEVFCYICSWPWPRNSVPWEMPLALGSPGSCGSQRDTLL